MFSVVLPAAAQQTVNVLGFFVCFFFISLSPLVKDVLLKVNRGISAGIRVTETETAEGVTVMGTGTLPCSVLVHYSIISQ